MKSHREDERITREWTKSVELRLKSGKARHMAKVVFEVIRSARGTAVELV